MTKSIILQSSTGINHACRSCYRSHNLSLYPSFSLKVLKLYKDLSSFGGQHDSLSFLGSGKGLLTSDKIKRKFVVSSNGQPGGPLPSPPPSNPFNGWLIGILLSIILPFFRNKWGSLLQLKNKVEDVIETVEEVVEEVENVAEEVDKVAEEIGKDLPEGQLKDTLKAVENFSEETAKFAHAAGDIIDKVQDVELIAEKRVKSSVESVTDEVNKSTISKIDINSKK
ncbi:uncharacterized protein LOC107807736 [Nicotiana tabacum]|uniref:Uncharacterized protein LOC107807736 n=1 Tax=Nicotiana tabacum TaxID=4097 RepID=A0A1S4BFK6_TOBAC|nr:uncharacterized protein LOC104086889 [Nicotiana tomentosiformis]XP_016487662.1 PREDICTED: uncharacterized protein LOC107807736 [Nicotiana tabacum]